MKAVFESRIEAPYRFTLLALAWFADDYGAQIRPGTETLTRWLGVDERCVYDHLKELVARRLIIPVGYHKRYTRVFHLDLDVLQTYNPPPVKRLTRKPGAKAYRTPVQSDKAAAVCTPVLEPLNTGAVEAAQPCTAHCTPVSFTLHTGAADLNDPSVIRRERHERAAAVAPARLYFSKHELQKAAEYRRKVLGGCRHQPRCERHTDCIKRIASFLFGNQQAVAR